MDPKHAGDILKHLEKQEELLDDAKKSLLEESSKLEVEQNMLMEKFFEFMVAQGFVGKKTGAAVKEGEERSGAGALVVAASMEEPSMNMSLPH